MSEDEDIVRTTVRMPRHLRDAAKAKTDHGELSEMVRGVYRRIAFGEDVEEHAQLEQELRRAREEKDDIRSEIRALQADLEEVERREARLEERLSEKNSRADKYDGALQTLEGMLMRGERVFVDHPVVKDAARVGGVPQEEVIEELQTRNPEIPDHAFVDGYLSDKDWDGVNGDGGDV